MAAHKPAKDPTFAFTAPGDLFELPAPTNVDELNEFLALHRARIELARTEVELRRIEADFEQASRDLVKARFEREGCSRQAEREDLELRRTQIEVARIERESRNEAARADEAMVYSFYDTVKHDTVRAAVATLDEWSRRRPGSPIEVQLSSFGGSVFDGLALYDFLRALRDRGHHVTVTVLGFAASMGAVLLQAGDRRRMGPNSYVMIHELSTGTYGKQSEMEEDVEFSRRLQDRLIKILCSRSNLTVPQVRDMWRKRDIWFDAAQAKRLGLIDDVIK
jgi:ATP-dependent Clp endopeptidase proteolytic subunit ClpP